MGSKWMLLLRLLSRGSGTLVAIILARILTPEDFGLVAVGILAVSLFQVFSEVGIKQALIKESEVDTEKMLDTAWTIEFVRGLIIFILVFLNAGFMADFFNKSEATNVIRILGFLPLINSSTSIKIIYLQKELKFKKQFIYEITGIVGPLLITIPLAFILQNVWAIVIGTLSGEFIKMIASYFVMPYKPSLTFNTKHFSQMFRFGKWILLGGIVSYFAMELDTYVAAKVFNASLLGIYVLAFSLSNKPAVEISKVLGKILFPAFAKIGHDIERTKKAFLKSSYLLYLILIPVCLGLSLIAEDFVMVVLGKKWETMIPALQILSVGALFRSLTVPAGGLFNGIGKPNLVFILSSIRMSVLIIFIAFFYRNLGLITLSIAVLLSNIIFLSLFIIYLRKYIFLYLNDFILNYLSLIIAVAVMCFAVMMIIFQLNPGIIRLTISILTGVTSYCGAIILLNRTKRFNHLNEYIKPLLNKIKNED